jgi:signal transduction histidine kinase
MADLHTLLERMRRDLAAVEAGITAAPPPVAVAWLEIDSGGIVRDVTPMALERLGLDGARVIDRHIGAVLDLEGDPLVATRLEILSADGRVPALSLPRSGGAVVILGEAGEPAPDAEGTMRAAPRRLVHDLANVLGVIRGRAEMVGLEQTSDLARRCISEIVAAVDRAQEMLDATRDRGN